MLPWKLWLCLIEREIRRDFPDRIKLARAAGDKATAASLEHDYQFNLRDIAESRLNRTQQKIIRKARRLMIPVPEKDIDKILDHLEDDNWYYGATEVLLKDEAMLKLRREVRAEQKERFESYARWIMLIIGLIGTTTGLISVLQRK